jgi:hypothetical protein
MADDPHALTLARAPGQRLCKTRCADGRVEDYARAFRFDLDAVVAPDLAGLAGLLRDLATRRDTCVLRGAIADPARVRGGRRLLHPDPKTGEAATLVETPRAWLPLDMDGLPLPAGTDPRDLIACGEAARAALPGAFHRAAMIVQATASHGFKPGARLRLWCLLSRPMSGAECRRWLRDAPVDRSVLGAAQVIYTAAPVFIGMADPLPRRLAILAGAEPVVAVPDPAALAPPPTRPAAAEPIQAAAAGRYAMAALTRAAARIATTPEGGRHDAALREAWGLARLVRAGVLSEAELARTIAGALRQAGKAAEEGEAIAAWAIAHRQDGALPEGVRR